MIFLFIFGLFNILAIIYDLYYLKSYLFSCFALINIGMIFWAQDILKRSKKNEE